MSIHIESFYHKDTSTWSYVVHDEDGYDCAVVDPVLDFDLSSGVARYDSALKLIEYIKQNKLHLQWILETHAHADHLTAAQFIKQQLGGQIVIGAGIKDVQKHFAEHLNLDITTDGSQFDTLLSAGDRISLGNHEFIAHPTPGHTDDSMSYEIDGNVFIGDTFFHPDTGTARCDFPGGSAKKLFKSLNFLTSFPDDYNLWLCHDYPSEREPIAKTTVSEQKHNIHFKQSEGQVDAYAELREKRDSTLAVPKLIFPSIQVNIRAGQFPSDESNGRKYLKLPFSVTEG
ncbi:MBL fold metallo-hydrolase [Kangiella sediminilitoris]|uniref:Beta-lactamase n=1 Tax=Kangiella sediminilitoris TaxID=1144748 RepID=A0A1B3B7J4_9GAMM|nr:MBL fold metallo-hydrolase [Kangiella sediminilitoris]AOE48748.1 beta-lactamase [Kangiella sediminilitoris]